MPKVKSVYYERTIQLRQYEPLKIGVTVEAEDGDTGETVLEAARDYVAAALARAQATR